MHYFKRYWHETTGLDPTDSWGTSYYYLEAGPDLYVSRQIQLFENGHALKYDDDYFEDRFGGLATGLDLEEMEPYHISKDEFEFIWATTTHYKRFPEIVLTEDTLWGQPRLEGRRLSVGDVVSLVHTYSTIDMAMNDFELSLGQIRVALHYCKALQCEKDNPSAFCHNCTLRVKQDGAGDGEEQDNWIIAHRLFKEHFG